MSIWKNKESYFIHLDKLHEKGVDFITNGSRNGNRKSSIEEFDLTKNADQNLLNLAKENMSDKLFEHISYSYIQLSIYDLLVIISTEKEIELFKRSKMSSDGTQYDMQTDGLRSNADYMTMFTFDSEPEEIRIPIQPNVSLLAMLDYFKKKKTKKDTIHEILVYFQEGDIVPKPNQNSKVTKLIREICTQIENDLVNKGIKDSEDIGSMIKDALGDYIYYTPVKDLTFEKRPFKSK